MYTKKKPKILFLNVDDNHLAGHAVSAYENIPNDYFDKKIVVLRTLYNDMEIGIFNAKSLKARILSKLWRYWNKLRFCNNVLDEECKSLYCYYNYDFSPISATHILNKLKGFQPDIIVFYWTTGFISSDIMKGLYQKTKAFFLFVLVDEAHIGGGCHYSVDCDGYTKLCTNCPAFIKGGDIAHKQFIKRKKMLDTIPFAVAGSPYACRKALQSSVLKSAKFTLSSVLVPQVDNLAKKESRKFFGIAEDTFVVMIGAATFEEKRKGFEYAIRALEAVKNKIQKLVAIIPGNLHSAHELDSDIRIITPGYLNKETLLRVFSASDCFVSTTIGDTGPMMVNYSIAMGTPVISFHIGIAQDLVLHKETGYIAKYKDYGDVASGLLYMANLSMQEKERMRNNCLELMRKYKEQKNRWINLYEKYMELNKDKDMQYDAR